MDCFDDVKRMCGDGFGKACAEGTLRGVCKTLGAKYVEDGKPSGSKGVVYRVVAGSYGKKDRAEGVVEELKGKGYDAFMVDFQI